MDSVTITIRNKFGTLKLPWHLFKSLDDVQDLYREIKLQSRDFWPDYETFFGFVHQNQRSSPQDTLIAALDSIPKEQPAKVKSIKIEGTEKK